ncbi:MAG: hypothetical protein AAGK21_13825 [Bacteroidota bacterium]
MKLSQSDASFLLGHLDLTPALRRKLTEGSELSSDESDDLRDLVCDRLMTHGFDEDYSPNDEGRQLERLIDVLYTG